MRECKEQYAIHPQIYLTVISKSLILFLMKGSYFLGVFPRELWLLHELIFFKSSPLFFLVLIYTVFSLPVLL